MAARVNRSGSLYFMYKLDIWDARMIRAAKHYQTKCLEPVIGIWAERAGVDRAKMNSATWVIVRHLLQLIHELNLFDNSEVFYRFMVMFHPSENFRYTQECGASMLPVIEQNFAYLYRILTFLMNVSVEKLPGYLQLLKKYDEKQVTSSGFPFTFGGNARLIVKQTKNHDDSTQPDPEETFAGLTGSLP